MKTEHPSDVKKLCSMLYLQYPECKSSPMLFSVISSILDASLSDVIKAAERLMDKKREDSNVDLFLKHADGTLAPADFFDFKVMLCIAFADKINLKQIVGAYQLDVLTIVTDMTKDRLEKAIAEAQAQGLIELPSKGSA